VGEPIIAIVSLRNQEITVYDTNGWILPAPVSRGQKGRETTKSNTDPVRADKTDDHNELRAVERGVGA
jgi:hypothetical protein